MMNIAYRPDIDGLRAIAVIAVLVYHAEFVIFGDTVLSGGYLGVDIFFVISGFLISKIILKELDNTGSFSFKQFYERRLRRIAPMLLLVVVVSSPFAWALMSPSQFSEYVHSILASFAFVSNVYFYFSTTEYGATNSLLVPFLHTWSLSIEEQFYVLFPFLAILLKGKSWRQRLAVFVCLSIISILIAEYWLANNQDLNFYLLPSRAWQLLAGACLACIDFDKYKARSRALAEIASISGIFLVVLSMSFFSHKTSHPGFVTLLPMAGICLLIHFAATRDKQITLVGTMLSSRLFVYVGLLSYSLYLWHFPILAFLRIYYIEIGLPAQLSGLALSFVLSMLSYSFFENRFRDKTRYSSGFVWSRSVSGFSLVAVLLITASITTSLNQSSLRESREFYVERDNKLLQEQSKSFDHSRKFSGESSAKHKVLIVGNSHAEGIFKALTMNKELFPSLDVAIGRTQMVCFMQTDNKFFRRATYQQADVIIVSTRWANRRCDKKNLAEEIKSDLDGVKILIEKSLADGKKIAIMTNSLEVETRGSNTFIDVFLDEFGDTNSLSQMREFRSLVDSFMYENRYTARNSAYEIRERLFKIGEEYNILVFDKEKIQCDFSVERCYALTDDYKKTIYDYGHWTIAGSRYFGEKIAELGWIESLISSQRRPELEMSSRGYRYSSDPRTDAGVGPSYMNCCAFVRLRNDDAMAELKPFSFMVPEDKEIVVKFIGTGQSEPSFGFTGLVESDLGVMLVARDSRGVRVGGRVPVKKHHTATRLTDENGIARYAISIQLREKDIRYAMTRLQGQAALNSVVIDSLNFQLLVRKGFELSSEFPAEFSVLD